MASLSLVLILLGQAFVLDYGMTLEDCFERKAQYSVAAPMMGTLVCEY